MPRAARARSSQAAEQRALLTLSTRFPGRRPVRTGARSRCRSTPPRSSAASGGAETGFRLGSVAAMSAAASAPDKPAVVVVTGPTSAGKTALAIELAEKFGGEIVNADSMQVYRFMDIGTAKPTPEQRARVPHHLIDVVTPDVPYNAGRYVGEARSAASAIHARGKIVVWRGQRASTFARSSRVCSPPAPPTPSCASASSTRTGARARRAPAAPARAAARGRSGSGGADPCERCAPHHPRARDRAAHGPAERPAARGPSLRRSPVPRAPARPRSRQQVLDRRIDAACARMLEAGLLREVRGLCERGYGPELPRMQAIGYRHLLPVVRGADTLRNALAAMQRDTRRFARRQRTWLRGVPEARWFDPAARDAIFAAVEEFLRGADAAASAALRVGDAELDVERRRVVVDQRLVLLGGVKSGSSPRRRRTGPARQELDHAGERRGSRPRRPARPCPSRSRAARRRPARPWCRRRPGACGRCCGPTPPGERGCRRAQEHVRDRALERLGRRRAGPADRAAAEQASVNAEQGAQQSATAHGQHLQARPTPGGPGAPVRGIRPRLRAARARCQAKPRAMRDSVRRAPRGTLPAPHRRPRHPP